MPRSYERSDALVNKMNWLMAEGRGPGAYHAQRPPDSMKRGTPSGITREQTCVLSVPFGNSKATIVAPGLTTRSDRTLWANATGDPHRPVARARLVRFIEERLLLFVGIHGLQRARAAASQNTELSQHVFGGSNNILVL